MPQRACGVRLGAEAVWRAALSPYYRELGIDLRHLLENLKGNFVMKDDIDGEDASFGYKGT